jgi:ribosome-associated protein
MHALQELGEALIALPKDALKRMPMPEKLDDAVREARRITDHEGKRRQLQYVGKVMRSLLDDETAALRTALDSYNGINKAETARLHWIERTREKLLADDAALTDFIRQHPAADPQEGRTLIRNARKEAQQSKPPRYFRELFQWIKNADGPEAAEGDEHDAQEDDDDEDRA